MADTILEHLAANADYYKGLHTVDVFWDAKENFRLGNYCKSIADVISIAIAHVLHLSLSIYWEGPDGNIQLIEQTSNNRCRDVHLKFIHDPRIQLTTTMMPYCCMPNPVILFGEEQACEKGKYGDGRQFC